MTRDRERGTLAITKENYTKYILDRFGMGSCNLSALPASAQSYRWSSQRRRSSTPRTRSAIRLSPVPQCTWLRSSATTSCTAPVSSLGLCPSLRRFTWERRSTFSAIFLGQRISASRTRKEVYSPILRLQLGQQSGQRKIHVIVHHDDGKGPVRFKSGLQSLTAMLTMEAERVAVGLAMKEVIFCTNMMTELGFGSEFSSAPLYIGNTATLNAIGNKTWRTKHVALRFFYIRELMKEEKIGIHYVPTSNNLADIGTKHLNKQRHKISSTKSKTSGRSKREDVRSRILKIVSNAWC